MNQMICGFTHVIHVAFRGVGRAGSGDLIAGLYKFMNEHDIVPATCGGASGGGIYIASFFADDARKIKAFMTEQGVECQEIVK